MFEGGSVKLSGKGAKGWLQGCQFVKASVSVSQGKLEVARSKGNLASLSGTGAALTFDSPDFGSITLSVSGGALKFSGAKTVVKGISVSDGADGGVLKGVVMAGAVVVSGKGSKLSFDGGSGAATSITARSDARLFLTDTKGLAVTGAISAGTRAQLNMTDSSFTFTSTSGSPVAMGASASVVVKSCTISYASAATAYSSALFAVTGDKAVLSIVDSIVVSTGGARVYANPGKKGASATFDNVSMTSNKIRTVTLGIFSSDGFGGAIYDGCGDATCRTKIESSLVKGFGVNAKAGTYKRGAEPGSGCNSCQGAYGGALFFAGKGELILDKTKFVSDKAAASGSCSCSYDTPTRSATSPARTNPNGGAG